MATEKNSSNPKNKRQLVFSKNSTVADTYRVEFLLGMGTFGQVYSVTDLTSGAKMALKVCTDPCARIQNQAFNEARLTKNLSRDDSKHRIVRYVEHFTDQNRQCLVMGIEPYTLKKYVSTNYPLGMDTDALKRIAKSLLEGVQYLEKKEIIHRDIKSNNILVNADGECVIADFGVSVPSKTNLDNRRFQVAKLRAPEIILQCPGVGYRLDMWSVGLVLAAVADKSIEIKSREEKTTLARYVDMFGMPPTRFLTKCNRTSLYFRKAGDTYELIDKVESSSVKLLQNQPLSRNSQERSDITAFYGLLTNMLQWNPADRIGPQEALKHSFFKGEHRGLLDMLMSIFR